MNFAGFDNAFQGASGVTDALQRQQDTDQQMQARAMLAKVLQQYAAAQQGGQPQPQGAPNASTVPAMPPAGGVSPPMGSPAPAAGAPGGAGPSSPMGGAPAPASAGAPDGVDLQRLVQAIMAQKGNPGAQGYALQDSMKLLQPQANNALKLDLGQLRSNTQEDIADKNIAARKAVADANNAIKAKQGAKPINDPVYRAKEQEVKTAQAVYTAKPTRANWDDLAKKSATYMDYATGMGSGVKPTEPTQATSPTGGADSKLAPVPVPPEEAGQPDGATATDANGQRWVKQGNQMIPQ